MTPLRAVSPAGKCQGPAFQRGPGVRIGFKLRYYGIKFALSFTSPEFIEKPEDNP